MKINRLLEITIILLNRGTVTAKELAERFGVSTRTIYRDVEVLSGAGVPVYGSQGVNGGISLLDNYTLNKTLLSEKEGESIMFALKTLQGTKYPEIDTILDKMGAIFKTGAADWVHIDFSPWGSNPNYYERLTNIKSAILNCWIIEFDYLSSINVKTHRRLEPLRLIFKGQAWYLWGFCFLRNDFRVFRLSRIRSVSVTDQHFDRSRIHFTVDSCPAEVDEARQPVELELKFTQEAMHRLYDDYDDEMIVNNGDGTYTLKIVFPEDEWVYSYILSFGDYVEVVRPSHIKEIIIKKIANIQSKYGVAAKRDIGIESDNI